MIISDETMMFSRSQEKPDVADTLQEVYTAKSPHDKALQRALLQYYDPKNRDLCEEALRKTGRADLIGFGAKCLIRPNSQIKQNK